ncbi:MAG: copper resistance protein [Actinomycetota bacterium]|jgi:methionine-rich copper-binding protein CopC|nr:copper resistance protein [Actinomycetota bacterium]
MAARFYRGLPVALIAFALTLSWSAPASAHAAYKDSDPADESTISSSPTSVWAEFTEPVSDASTLKIYDPCGEQVDGGDVERSGYRMTVSMSSDRQGEFTVRFVANSSLDGHTTSGEFTFTATDGAPCAPPADEKDDTGTTKPDSPRNDQAEQSDAAEEPVPATQDDPVTEAAGSDNNGNTSASDGTNGGRGGKSGGDRKKEIQLAADKEPPAPKGPSLFGDMPWGSFGMALAFALVIGAAGGKVYAGIMGPRA